MPSKGAPIPECFLAELAPDILRHVVPVHHVTAQAILARDAFATEDAREGKPRRTEIPLGCVGSIVGMVVGGVGITG